MKILAFDTETTGIPLWRLPSGDKDQPHLTELAAKLVDSKNQEVIKEMNVMIKTDGWEIPQECVYLNGITKEILDKEGIPEKDAINQFMQLYKDCDLRISHNTTFDNRIIRIGLKRYFDGLVSDEEWKDKSKYYCTLINFRKLVGGKSGHTLGEAYKYFTRNELDGAHRAMVDVDACLAIYFNMNNQFCEEVKNGK